MNPQNSDVQDALFLLNFISDNAKAGKLSKNTAEKIRDLWNEYRLSRLENDCAVISADFGELGSLVIRSIDTVLLPEKLKYESGSYDYVDMRTEQTTRILWTDYKNIEPYNRQSGLYCDGASFSMLGKPVVEKENYREFVAIDKYHGNISFPIWGFKYNEVYGSVHFGICLKKNLVDDFVSKLRNIIGK